MSGRSNSGSSAVYAQPAAVSGNLRPGRLGAEIESVPSSKIKIQST
jgi:hypothetical protein